MHDDSIRALTVPGAVFRMNMPIRNPLLSALIPALLWAAPAAANGTDRLSDAQLQRFLHAEERLHPGDDIQSDFRNRYPHRIDVDGDGEEEIVFYTVATCVHANFDCTSAMSLWKRVPAELAERTFREAIRLMPDHVIADYRVLRDVPLKKVAQVHIPGIVTDIRWNGRRAEVHFDVRRGNPYCKRAAETADGFAYQSCPALGRHVWTFEVRPDRFERVQARHQR